MKLVSVVVQILDQKVGHLHQWYMPWLRCGYPPINKILVIFWFFSLSLSLSLTPSLSPFISLLLALFFFDCIKSDKKIRNFQFNQEYLKGNIFRLYMTDLNSPIAQWSATLMLAKKKQEKRKESTNVNWNMEISLSFPFTIFLPL